MTILVAGASGATGKLLVEQLLNAGEKVKVIIRPTANIPDTWSNNNNITIIKTNILEISRNEMAKHLADCGAVASCLGHNIT
ncbi:MAG: NAD(P)H-binding protein, partial [Ignavibacteria bacterium]